MSSWARGRDEIVGMLQRRELTQVVANTELAERMLSTARQHLLSAEAATAVADAADKALQHLSPFVR